LIIPKLLKISHKKFVLYLRILKKTIKEKYKNGYEEMGKKIKDLIFSCVDKNG